ncbi:MAG: amino acid adenylation domain-containing protein, partial [Candidatus Parabeggiatoa sp.]|nr:amino acid adenylation domain-containing protein [Candidatus Parabeggiatoa sp.]
MLVEQLQPTRSLSYSPLFQVMLVLQNNESAELTLPGLDISALTADYPIAKFDLTLNVEEQHGELHCSWEYTTDLFYAETIERMAGNFEVLLTAIVDNPAQAIIQLPMLTEKEVQQLLAWNDTATEYPVDKTVVDLFEQQVEKTPDNVAVVFEGQALSYQVLNTKANQLAHYLMTLGVKAETLVGICIERSLDMVIGLLGILKAGSAYVPIDPSYPAARIQSMLEDSRTPVLLTQSHLKAQLPTLERVTVCLDEAAFANQPTDNPKVNHQATDLAYVIYTSGSTGMPKGVMVEHKGLVNLALAQINTFHILLESRVLQFASFSFDASVSEITTTLLTGATLYLVSKELLLDTTGLTTMMLQQQISHITLPPSFLSNLPEQALSTLKTLVVAGEICSPESVKQWADRICFINAYGPTESTVCASMAVCFSEMNIPHIGQPIANTRIYILDAQHQLQPPGIPGELCIAGRGIARGYLNRPELSKEKFIQVELFGKTERIYKTGDLARWLPDGNLEYLGRIDSQVKLRGFRIELGEIEAVLNRHPRINEAVVVHNSENNCLNAYISQRKCVELWPSIAEFYVYDDIVYHSMAAHESRNQQYLAAFQRVLPGKMVVEIGPGPEVILSRLALQAGAKKIYAIELLEESYRKAQDTVKQLGISDRIILIHGDAALVTLPEPVDYCISEIVGSIGGSEGAAIIINNARRFLKDGSHMIPQRSMTKIAAVSIPESLFQYGFVEIAAHYTQRIFEQVGYFFDLRLCVKNLPLTQLISNHDVFEYLDYRYPIKLESRHEIGLWFNQNSMFTGLLVWLTLQTDTDHIVDILTEQHSWLPIYIPLFTGGEPVKTGDKLVATITRQLCDNQFNPDYLLEGTLYRQGQPDLPFRYHSYHFKSHYREHSFYQKLFSDDTVPILPKLNSKTIRDYLSEHLPEYMVPSQFMLLDHLPLTPNGKIDRKALPVPDALLTNKHYQTPRDTVELQLSQIWKNVLDRHPIGITDNFFELGGHSLLAVRLMAQIEQQFNKHLPLATLFQNVTIEELANQLRQQTDSQTWSSLVAIQPNGTKPPFFCVPGVGGNVLYFYELAHHLGLEQPFYALQAVGLDGKSMPFTSIEEMATHYLKELQTVQPRGPYLLGGHSFGGLVAFEMSLQLQKQGHEVAFLGIFDMIAPPFTAVGVEWDDTQWLNKIAQFIERELGQKLEVNDDRLQSLDADAQLDYLNEQLKKAHVIPKESSVTQLRGLVNVFKANSQISYAPLEITKTPITLFKAKEARGDVFENEPTCGWHQLSESGVSVQIVPGDHFTMMKKPDVQVLAAQLQEALEQAEYKL